MLSNVVMNMMFEDIAAVLSIAVNIISIAAWTTLRQHISTFSYLSPVTMAVLMVIQAALLVADLCAEAKYMIAACSLVGAACAWSMRNASLKRAELYTEIVKGTAATKTGEELVALRVKLMYYETLARRLNLPSYDDANSRG